MKSTLLILVSIISEINVGLHRRFENLNQVLKRVTPLYIIFDGPLFSCLLIRDGEQMDVTLRYTKKMAH